LPRLSKGPVPAVWPVVLKFPQLERMSAVSRLAADAAALVAFFMK
jgi:hypothetical protein